MVTIIKFWKTDNFFFFFRFFQGFVKDWACRKFIGYIYKIRDMEICISQSQATFFAYYERTHK